jgi:MEDS: MEthanogen/methylotroph, DcmR Sensory domain
MKSCRGSWCVLRGSKLCQRLRDESDLSELYTAPDFVHNVRMAHGFRQGEHICSLYDTEEEQLATAAAYLADGLSRGERGLYIGADRNAVLRFRTALGAVGLDAAALVERGALIEFTHDETYLADGKFNIERLITMLRESVQQAADDGFSGWRGCGEMSWLLTGAPDSEELSEYEALVNQLFSGARACAMCQYNRKLLPASLIDMALATHSIAVIAGRQRFNPFFQPGDAQ